MLKAGEQADKSGAPLEFGAHGCHLWPRRRITNGRSEKAVHTHGTQCTACTRWHCRARPARARQCHLVQAVHWVPWVWTAFSLRPFVILLLGQRWHPCAPNSRGAPLLSACSPAFSLSIQPFPTNQGGNPVRLKNKIAVITGGGQAHDRAEVRLHRQHRVGRRPVSVQLG